MDFETLWEATIGLIVEDGWIATGAVVALLLTWLLSVVARAEDNDALLNLAGPLLMVLVVVLVLTNLFAAGRAAARKRVA
jgi:high-affinity Fe2+/Pb2+ permease